ncbi:EF-P beta-lysylation protein EpmB [Teredinibacter haidensis]|uniref:EF-P beta-lysylation protein EpmB n=1 Tax=Teredinibacter haidensis TaxID=2731755 RepID=UPI0009FA98F4|nr:EF-P beta-lysylation protein EpmB [Teredinibacter haidensis]
MPHDSKRPIPQTNIELTPINAPQSWQDELANLVCEPEQLLDALQLDAASLPEMKKAAELFPLRVPRSYLARIKKGDLNDPLLRQVLPLGMETLATEGYTIDPLGEKQSNPAPGLVHKYRGRVLLIAAPQCAIHCRYCFRRHFDYNANTPSREKWQEAFQYIMDDPSIEEVILSGGDPLALSDRQLGWLYKKISQIPHITRIRIHTRLPIVVPSRITTELLNILRQSPLPTVMVTHCNHPQEIDVHVQQMFKQLKGVTVTILNQAVLLKSINDNAPIQATLSKRLFSCGVMPYYLHLLDKVSGAAHFNVEEGAAKRIYNELLATLPGYLVPKLVREAAGAKSKTPVL